MSQPHPTNIHFLQIEVGESSPIRAKERLLFSLTSAYVHADKTVLIAAAPEFIHGIDQMLWGYLPESFIPHGVLPCELDALSVLLTYRPCEIEGIDVLIVASPVGGLDWMTPFPTVIDFVEVDIPQLKEQSRLRFKQWCELGTRPSFHKIDESFDIQALVTG